MVKGEARPYDSRVEHATARFDAVTRIRAGCRHRSARLARDDVPARVDAISQQSSKSSRSCARPRCTRDFMPESETPAISAASFCETPSSSVSTRASR